LFKSKFYGFLVFICAQFIIWTFVIVLVSGKPVMFNARGENRVTYDIVYLDNDIFSDEVRPQGTYDLLSYTDYIELNNSFSAEFSEESDTSYWYTAKETFIIKHQRTSDNNTNPIVYSKETILSELAGSVKGESMHFGGENENTPGGLYVVDFDEHIKLYEDFINQHQRMLDTRDFNIDKNVHFTAELLIEFTYDIKSGGISQAVTRGVRFPISLEVYLPEFTGNQSFSSSVETGRINRNLTALTIVKLCLWLAANIFGIYFGIRKLLSYKSKQIREADKILNKYSDEIIMSEIPLDLSAFKIIPVPQFKELLKLAITINKHILCYNNNDKVDFCVCVDGYAYRFGIDYEV